jgi:Zn-dependent peptidase ImmA (M78 family)
MTLAHEYSHFLTNRYNPEIQVLRYERRPDSERFADAFAARFLLPGAGVRRQLRAHVQAGGSFTVGDLLHFARYFNVSFEAYCYRLEEMGILAAGTSDSYKAEGLQVRKAQELVGIQPTSDSLTHKLPDRYQLLAVRAYLMEELTEGQLMRYLEASRLETREIVRKLQEQITLDQEGIADITELALEERVLVRSR